VGSGVDSIHGNDKGKLLVTQLRKSVRYGDRLLCSKKIPPVSASLSSGRVLCIVASCIFWRSTDQELRFMLYSRCELMVELGKCFRYIVWNGDVIVALVVIIIIVSAM